MTIRLVFRAGLPFQYRPLSRDNDFIILGLVVASILIGTEKSRKWGAHELQPHGENQEQDGMRGAGLPV